MEIQSTSDTTWSQTPTLLHPNSLPHCHCFMHETPPPYRPPRYALQFFRWYCRADRREELEGDLEEMYHYRLTEQGAGKARRGFWLDVLRSFRPYAWRPDLFSIVKPNQHVMFRNYVKTSFRNLLKNKAFASINIFGLALSMSVCLLIILIIKDQFSMDRHNRNFDQVYRIITEPVGGKKPFASSPLPLGTGLQQEYTHTEAVAQFVNSFKVDILSNNRELGVRGMFSNNEVLSVMDYPLASGNPANALKEPFSIVLTEATAKRFFGNEEALGRVMSLKRWGLREEGEPARYECTVTGVIDDQNMRSHLRFEALISLSTMTRLQHLPHLQEMPDNWRQIFEGYNYVQLEEGVSPAEVAQDLNRLAAKHYDKAKGGEYEFRLEPLGEISPRREEKSNPAGLELPIYIIYFLLGLGALILLMATFNYTNLSLARSLSRAKEVGIRRVSGATRTQVISQFLVEAVVVSLLALLLALGMLQFLTEAFYGIDPEIQNVFDLQLDWQSISLFLLFAIAVGLGAGIVPAILMARFKPVTVLKGIGMTAVKSKFSGRKVLAVIQFTLSIVFVITSYTTYVQFSHVMDADLGLNGENVVCILVKSNEFPKLENTFLAIASVESVGASNLIPNTNSFSNTYLHPLGQSDSAHINYMSITPSYFDVMQLELLVGRNFNGTVRGKQNVSQIILNETAVERLGLESPEKALGTIFNYGKSPVEVIGVVKDFSYNTIHNPIEPFMFVNIEQEFYHVSLRATPGEHPRLLSQLEEQWYRVDDVHEFEYGFYDEKIAEAEALNVIMVKVVGFAGFLSITIACLGLLGMALFTSSTRRKEIGIRKTHGASVWQIVLLLSKGFMWILLIAIAFALPLAYFLNNFWLQNYAYRIPVGISVLLPGVVLVSAVGLLTIGSQTFKAARLNPSETLRDE